MTNAAPIASAVSLEEKTRPHMALCLGGHRSGTSLISAALEALGANLALFDHQGSEENSKGFFEHPEVVAIDNELLRLAGSSWDDGIFGGRMIQNIPEAELLPLHDRARRLIREQWRTEALSGVKDPRMCRLLPFWFSALQAEGYERRDIRCILVTRDPVEIAISQRTRCKRNPDYYDFGQTLDEGIVLWLNHILPVLRECADQQVLIVAYSDFLTRPGEIFARIAQFLQVDPDQTSITRFINDFLDRSQWRSHATPFDIAEVEAAFPGLLDAERILASLSGEVVGRKEISPVIAALEAPPLDIAAQRIVSRAYGRLADRRRQERQEALRTENALKVMQRARDEFARSREEMSVAAGRIEQTLRGRLAELEAGVQDRDNRLQQEQVEREGLLQHNGELTERIAAVEAAKVDLQAQLRNLQQLSDSLHQMNEALRASRSWRVTKPLRQAGEGVRQMRFLPQMALRALNRASQVSHQRLKRSHPRTAEFIRRKIQPLMLRANLKFLGQYSVPAQPAPPAPNPSGLPAGIAALDYQRMQALPDYRPLVTVIVPNYNHAPYLAQRLESIFAQTYDHFEVLLLDDCSSDDSQKVLEEFAARHPDRTRLLFNEENSGGVFRQWEKGLAAARGDLVWIAESDDWADPNFLEALVPFFRNEAVQLAYARTVFMDGAGENQIWSMEEYLHQFGPERWSRAWIDTAPNIVRDVFSMTNIIPNVSSALFRRFERLDVLEIDRWREMRTCGDWMFYLNVIRGGMIAYTPEAQSFYRIHDKNTSVKSHKGDKFYREHEEVAKCLRRHYRVPPESLTKMEQNLRHHWKITRSDYSDAAFSTCFERARIEAAPSRRPGLLMASYGFCAGGGETFPIQLANEMKAIGYEVTFLDCGQEGRVDGVRAMLASDVPVISNFSDLRRIIENFDIDLIHSHHGWVDHTILDLLPAEASCQTVVTLHGFYETIPPEQLNLLLPRLIRRSGGLVFTAEKNLGAIRQAGLLESRPFHRIDNALSRSDVTPIARETLGIAPDAFLLTLVSRALHSKGWAEAVEAVGRARELSGRDIQLILIGEGEAKDAIEADDVPPHVHLEGFRQNIREYFAASDLGFLPSRFPGESFPLVVIDSLNAGTPVLASDVGEIRYMLTTEEGPAGALFQLDEGWQINVEALAAQIARLAGDAEEMNRLRARAPLAAARFDPRRMAEKYDLVYAGTTGQNRKSA